MPYVKPYKKQFASMERLLLGYKITASKLADILGCTYPTAKKRLDDPGAFTLEELHKVCTRGHIPIEEMREAIQA